MLFAWGANTHGELGVGDRERRLDPARVEGLGNQRMVQISLSEELSALTLTLTLTLT